MPRAEVREIECKSVINPVKGMPFRWSANPYRGCTHACLYCYARVTHTYLDLGPGEDFQRILFAKVNAPAVIRRELARPGWRRELVAIGTSTDPYQPIEGRYRLTRGLLEALAEYRTPASLTTKSTLVVRDRDVLQELDRAAGATVYVSIGTLDREVWRRLEPGTPSPQDRLRAVAMLAAAGIPVAVLMAPILPGLTDRPASIRAVIAAAREAGAAAVHPAVLRLDPGVREYFLEGLAEHYPHLARSYERLYRDRCAPRAYVAPLERRVAAWVAGAGLGGGRPRRAAVGAEPQPGGCSGAAHRTQLTLPL